MFKQKSDSRSRKVGRREFLASVGGAGAGLTLNAAPLGEAGTPTPQSSSAPWKLDVTVYDRPGRTSTSYGLPLLKQANGDLLVGFQAQREDGLTDDFYSAHAEWVFVASSNGGKTWREVPIEEMPVDPRWPDRSAHCTYGWPVRLPDGTLINIVGEDPPREEHRKHLEKVGLGHLWFEDSTFGWDLWPESYTERLREQGLYVFDYPGPHLPPGIVATHNRPIVSTVSRDGGKTWTQRRIEGLPKLARSGGWFRGGVALDDGTVVGGMYGIVRRDGPQGGKHVRGVYAIRSHDRGETWHMSPIVEDPENERHLSETNMLVLPSGRILALIRGSAGAWLYRTYSDDRGKTWAPLEPTQIGGSPANMLRLASGNILCVYRNRGYPSGYSGVLSRDDGVTWDVKSAIRIRDDTLPGLIGYPSSAQLADGTIFTLYNVLRVGELQEDDHWRYKEEVRVKPPLHSYIAGSLYTEDYVGALGREA